MGKKKRIMPEVSEEKKIGRRELLVKAGRGAFLVSMGPILAGCDYVAGSGDSITGAESNNAANGNESTEEKKKFYFAVLSDTHIVTDYSSKQNQIMDLTVSLLNSYNPVIDFVAITGDCVDSLPEDGYDYYFNNYTELDFLAKFKEKLNMPLYPAMGNHDYYSNYGRGKTEVTPEKEAREDVFIEKLGMPGPYYAVEHKGVKFLLSKFNAAG
jgi:predicted MPP superfamily phosphohydrolase